MYRLLCNFLCFLFIFKRFRPPRLICVFMFIHGEPRLI